MTDFATKVWYAVVFMEVFENHDEPDDNRYNYRIKIIALSQTKTDVLKEAEALNYEYSYSNPGVDADDVIDNLPDYVGSHFFTVKKYEFKRETIEHHKKAGRIIGDLNFKLQI